VRTFRDLDELLHHGKQVRVLPRGIMPPDFSAGCSVITAWRWQFDWHDLTALFDVVHYASFHEQLCSSLTVHKIGVDRREVDFFEEGWDVMRIGRGVYENEMSLAAARSQVFHPRGSMRTSLQHNVGVLYIAPSQRVGQDKESRLQ
jgi:hypothetical protein